MQSNCHKTLLTLIAAGVAGTAASVAGAAAPYLVNISGATLQQAFFLSRASTNDVCDVDQDGIVTGNGFIDQLAETGTGLTVPGQLWQVQYRSTGSIGGLRELLAHGKEFAMGADGVDISSGSTDNAWHNRTQYIAGGTPSGIANNANPGAAPRRSTIDGTFMVTTSTSDANSGVLIDIAPIDVPTAWAVVTPTPGTPSPKALPGEPGYGANPRTAVNKDGTPTTQGNLLADLTGYNTNTQIPDDCTVFDTRVSYAPVAYITNIGAGIQEICQSDLKWLLATGRTTSGENYMVITRDSGSGTRNAATNSVCLDPSWGVGENIGPETNSSANDRLGPDFQPSNKGGSSRMDATVQNHRLAIGYTGAERGVSSGWLTGQRIEVLAIKHDLVGGTEFARPFVDNVLDNGPNGYRIAGPAVFATIGDPQAAPAVPYCGNANGNPNMRNLYAAAYVNNIRISVDDFKSIPANPDDTLFTPGELLASQFILPTATDFVQSEFDPCGWIPNPNLNQALQDITRSISVLGQPIYETFNTTTLGSVPNRTTGITYTDGNTGSHYVAQNGTLFTYGSQMLTFDPSGLNRVAGDFNSDGLRNINDAQELVNAFVNPTWRSTEPIVPEIIGDFDGDGNFDLDDLKYWADGLAID
ncbi:MAG: hypothetical protein VYC34_02425, partial [Planctomycetota bacterium]|nr:hypothetical protein [Planctomycetota bacterium]